MQPALEHVRSILILRYSALGDVVLATSVLDPLKARFPDARIEWVADAAYAGLLEGLPQLSRVHRLEPRRRGSLREVLRDVQGRFDVALDLQNKLRTRLIAFAAADRTFRLVKRTPTQAASALLGRDPVIERAHATELYAEALRPLGVGAPGPLHVSLSPAARAEAETALRGSSQLVAIAPGSRWATKRWAPERFAAIGSALQAQGHPIALVGGPGDKDVLDLFRSSYQRPLAADFTALSVEGLAAAIGRCRLLVACDSGPVHIASALGVPSVVVFGPTSVKRWAPAPPSRTVSLELDCSPCTNHGSAKCPLGHHRCMKDLPEALVQRAIDDVLAGR